VPNGLAFSDFKGYDTWQDVAASQTENGLKVIAANPVMIDAYRFSRRFQDREDRVVLKKECRISLFRDGAGYPEIAFLHRKRQQEIFGHRRLGIRQISL
jgi:hypothetical protein